MRLRLRVTAALALLVALAGAQYTPNWASLDTRPLPAWYDEAKFGIFMHWGVYSVPSWGNEEGGASGEWYWWQLDGAKSPDYVRFHNASYGADFRYPQFAPMFTAELFNATEWAGILRDSGARYVVLTSKHHEGWCNWPAPVTGFDFPWDATATGPGRDLAGELTAAVREAGMHMGFYFSLLEWFNPLYVQDKLANFSTAAYVERIMLPQLQDLVRRYEPAVLWADGHWEAGAEYFASPRFLAWLYNHSPVRDRVVVNDRWGKECGCKHGGFLTCDDRFNPGTLQTRKWENAMTLDRHSWGFRRNAPLEDFLSAGEVLAELVTTVACGGNLLLNFGPTREGTIAPIFQERLRQVGQWMKVNGEAIYSSRPWRVQNDTMALWYTQSSDAATVYAALLGWPTAGNATLRSPAPGPDASVELLGVGPLQWSALQRDGAGGSGLLVQLPAELRARLPPGEVPVLRLRGVR